MIPEAKDEAALAGLKIRHRTTSEPSINVSSMRVTNRESDSVGFGMRFEWITDG